MSTLVRFTATPSMTSEKYDDTIRRLEGSSATWPPEGMAYHVAFTSDGRFRVSEIWDSKQQWEQFGKQLRPVLDDAGVELAGDPEIIEIHNIVQR
jgi:hypothetical protein